MTSQTDPFNPVMDSPFNRPPLIIGIAAALGGELAILNFIAPMGSAIVYFGTMIATVVVCLGLWMKYIQLSPDERQDGQFPKTISRTREFAGYRVDVDVETAQRHESLPLELTRTVTATATTADGEEVATASSTQYAGTLPTTVYDPKIDEDGNGYPEGEQTREVLTDLYDDILEYDANGTVEDTTAVDSALDVVFGESETRN